MAKRRLSRRRKFAAVGAAAFLLTSGVGVLELALKTFSDPKFICSVLKLVCEQVTQVAAAELPPPTPAQARPGADGKCKDEASAYNGGCWSELKKPPPCPEPAREYLGRCWMPVLGKPARLPSAGEPKERLPAAVRPGPPDGKKVSAWR